MTMISVKNRIQDFFSIVFVVLWEMVKTPPIPASEITRRKQISGPVLCALVLFEAFSLVEAILSQSGTALLIVLVALMICGLAIVFHRLGRSSEMGLLLIIAAELQCALILLTTSNGLIVADFSKFDVLIIAELVAICLLAPMGVILVAGINIVFIWLDILLQPHAHGVRVLFASDKSLSFFIQPLSLQIIVAVIGYLLLRSIINALVRADQSEELAQLRRREAERQRQEAERKRQINESSEYLLEVLMRAAHGDRTARIDLRPDNELGRIGNALNLLLMKLRRTSQVEEENKLLREEIANLLQLALEAKMALQQYSQMPNKLTLQEGSR